MGMTRMGHNIRNRGLLSRFHLVPNFVKMGQEQLNGIPFGSGMNVSRGKLTLGVGFISIRSLPDVELLQLGFCLIGKVASLVFCNLYFLTLLVQLPVERLLIAGDFDKALSQLPAKSFQGRIKRTLFSFFPLTGGVQPGVAPDGTSRCGSGNVDMGQ